MKKEFRHSSIKSLNADDQSSVLLLKGAAPRVFRTVEVTDLACREIK